MNCGICQSDSFETLYQGPIRLGKFGQWSSEHRTVYCCTQCKTGYLPGSGFNYESEEYRTQVDVGASVESYWKSHDADQSTQFQVLGSSGLRGKVIADIGCGAGSFLDVVRGMAQTTIGVEPCEEFGQYLKKNHVVYGYTEEAIADWHGKVDIATCFAVLEHVENPLLLLEEIRNLLKEGGRLLLSTPNYDDWMLEFHPETYRRFFYRQAHRWYFNGDSLKSIAELAGYRAVELIYKNRFDLSNTLHWLRDNKPTGTGKTQMFSSLDGSFNDLLEKSGKADFLYAWLTV